MNWLRRWEMKPHPDRNIVKKGGRQPETPPPPPEPADAPQPTAPPPIPPDGGDYGVRTIARMTCTDPDCLKRPHARGDVGCVDENGYQAEAADTYEPNLPLQEAIRRRRVKSVEIAAQRFFNVTIGSGWEETTESQKEVYRSIVRHLFDGVLTPGAPLVIKPEDQTPFFTEEQVNAVAVTLATQLGHTMANATTRPPKAGAHTLAMARELLEAARLVPHDDATPDRLTVSNGVAVWNVERVGKSWCWTRNDFTVDECYDPVNRCLGVHGELYAAAP